MLYYMKCTLSVSLSPYVSVCLSVRLSIYLCWLQRALQDADNALNETVPGCRSLKMFGVRLILGPFPHESSQEGPLTQ